MEQGSLSRVFLASRTVEIHRVQDPFGGLPRYQLRTSLKGHISIFFRANIPIYLITVVIMVLSIQLPVVLEIYNSRSFDNLYRMPRHVRPLLTRSTTNALSCTRKLTATYR